MSYLEPTVRTNQDKPWGAREFGVLDEDGNLVTFAERQDID
jgi:hypothetical protein